MGKGHSLSNPVTTCSDSSQVPRPIKCKDLPDIPNVLAGHDSSIVETDLLRRRIEVIKNYRTLRVGS